MPARKASSFSLHEALLDAHAANNRINAYLIENLPEGAWRATPPDGKGRDIASIAAHIHNVRVVWLKAVGAKELPAKIEAPSVTQRSVLNALDESSHALRALLRASLEGDGYPRFHACPITRSYLLHASALRRAPELTHLYLPKMTQGM